MVAGVMSCHALLALEEEQSKYQLPGKPKNRSQNFPTT